MYGSSADQIFAHITRFHWRAAHLLALPTPPEPEPPANDEREALALAARVDLRLPRLVAAFGLSPLAREALLCLVAFELDPFLRRLLQGAQRDSGRPWLELGTVAEVLGLEARDMPELARLVAVEGALARHALVEVERTARHGTPLSCLRVRAFDRVAQYLVGHDQLPRAMALIEPRDLLDRALVGAQERRTLLTRLRRAAVAREPITVEVTGAPGTGKRFVCEGLAARVGLPLITCDLRLVDAGELDDALHAARREARLANACLCLLHWDAQLSGGGGSRDAPSAAPDPDGPGAEQAHTMPLPLARFFEENELIVMLTAEEREPLLERHAHAIAHLQVPFPLPSQRAALLDEALGALGLVIERGVDLQAVVRRIALAPAALEVAARVAADLANDRDPYTRVVKHAELTEACQRQLHHDLKSLATRVTTTHRWEDLVIPVDVYESLREMIAYAAEANRVYEEWGFGARHGLSRGISALFAGPPGTGKTMCASVIARELDMELFRVDLSRIVSKWIGETEKNLAKVFDEAQRSNAVILFDEADSLFAKRTEVKSSVDRYANLEVNYLLQRMEGFSGVTILTTNFEDTIDTAFKRRLTFRMRFEKPDAEARTALWRKVFPGKCAIAADVDFERVGALFEFSGGNIRNAAVRAAFMAAAANESVNQRHVLDAAEREAREMGVLTRSPTPREREEEEAAAVAAAAHDGEVGDASATTSARPGSRLVPITHPRSRS